MTGSIKRSQAAQKGRIKSQDSSKGSTQALRPKFSFEKMAISHGIAKCEREEKAALADTLGVLGQMTWAEIMQASRHGSGCEIIDRDIIKAPGKDRITPDCNILAFRFSAMKPMIGYRLDETFYVVWLDRAMNVYDHG